MRGRKLSKTWFPRAGSCVVQFLDEAASSFYFFHRDYFLSVTVIYTYDCTFFIYVHIS